MADMSKLKVGSDTYDIKDSTSRTNGISQTDFLTVNNGFSITQFECSINDKLIHAHIIVSATNNFTSSNSTPFVIKSAYKPKYSFYIGCFMGSGAWTISNIGYTFLSSSEGSCVVVSSQGTYSHAIIELTYQI